MNNNKKYELKKNLTSTKLNISYILILLGFFEKEEKENNAFNELLNNYEELKKILNNLEEGNAFKLFYFFRKKVHTILYNTENTIEVDYIMLKEKIFSYFYLYLLISDDKDLVNYKYSIDLIRNNVNLQKNDNKNIYKTLILSIINIILIENYKQIEEDEENEDESDKMIEQQYNKLFNQIKKIR